jgi:DNA-binding CsgD family transcriptional regulator
MRAAFPDWHSERHLLVAEDDVVVELFTARGTQRGEVMGVAPTGLEVSLPGINIGSGTATPPPWRRPSRAARSRGPVQRPASASLDALAEDALRRLTPRPGDGLTEAEARLAELVGHGASNQQAASALSVSVKTVETTLTRVYRKLGMRSRAQLAAGWVQQPPQL